MMTMDPRVTVATIKEKKNKMEKKEKQGKG